ncbi:DUF3089 domain-containing protein [Gordonia insulae]|uniref:DUF3089 domain-containing protein n=1 Tax=Gordonia insulae TaxID=2420509 RepID=A0A3G8JF57_9ACTN|nr:DUF3089 domain-containing protein [Gordonia insulae]AZG43548.1 hypothetical protein D7316_00114 [Gordonia insulae]
MFGLRLRPVGRLFVAVGATVASLALVICGESTVAAEPSSPTIWLCSPTMASDPCDLPQDTTDLLTGRVSAPPPVTESEKPVDCFFVYGTATNALALNADPVASPEIQAAAKLHGARFNRTCRMFAPVYRQVSLPAGVLVNLGLAEPFAIAYRDVRKAWREYLAQADGRGVIFIADSQGAYQLRKLIREEVDPRPALRSRLAGAFLMGANVTTARGSVVGGDFRNIPVCSRRGEYGCVMAYSSNVVYPPVSAFGNSAVDVTSRASGLPFGPQYQVACTDPAVVSGDHAPVGITVPSEPFPPGLLAGFLAYARFPDAWPTSSSTWTTGRGRGVGSCDEVYGIREYHIRMIRPQPINQLPLLDTHDLDFSFGLDRLVGIAARQAEDWRAHSR